MPCRRRLGWEFFRKTTALGCLANVLEGGVEAVLGRVSAVSLGGFSRAAGTAGPAPASRRAVSLVLLIGIRVCAAACRAGIRLAIRRRVVTVWPRIRASPPALPRRGGLAVGVLAVGDRGRLRLLDGKPAIDRGVVADLLEDAPLAVELRQSSYDLIAAAISPRASDVLPRA